MLGFRHSNNVRDVMTPSVGPGTKVDHFQEHEAAALHMMYAHRQAGNRAPDRDPSVAGAAVPATWTAVID